MNPGEHYVIKGDGSDLLECLQETKDHKWFGDADMGDGKVQEVRDKFQVYIRFLNMHYTALVRSSWLPLPARI